MPGDGRSSRAMRFHVTACTLLVLLAAVARAQPVDDAEPDPSPSGFDGDSKVTLYLYTQENPSFPEIIKRGDKSTSPSFNASNPTRIVTHGFTGTYHTVEAVATAYLSTGREYNVVLVNWPAISLFAVKNSKLSGEYLASVIQDLVKNRGLKLDDVYLIGHSLGGQMMAVTGNRLGGKAARVVGLDAAGSSFERETLENRLDPSDGILVEGIHTNGGGSGFLEPLGDIDFFPNGGSKQAGCSILDISGICSHFRAIDYYVESITNGDFTAVLCDSYDSFKAGKCNGNARDVLGEYAVGSVPGTYYLTTKRSSPYAQGFVAQ